MFNRQAHVEPVVSKLGLQFGFTAEPPGHQICCESTSLRLIALMQIGIDSFVAIYPDPTTGVALSAATRLRNLLEEIELRYSVSSPSESSSSESLSTR